MHIDSFDTLVRAARQQAQAQQLLLVFAAVELPDDATPEQRAGFEAGEGGALVPLMCVDKPADELGSFAELRSEADSMSARWSIVLAGAMDGPAGGGSPDPARVQKVLDQLLEQVKAGRIDGLIPFDRQGMAVAMGR